MSKIFLLIDGHALIYRAYHAFPPNFINQEGVLVNAVYGFARVLLAGIRDFKPEYIAIAFDSKEKTARQKEFSYYKAHRPPMPEDLIPQIELIKKFVSALNIPQFAIPGEEADDIIGSMAHQLNTDENENLLTVIVTGDKDTFQLVNERVHVYLPAKGKSEPEEIDANAVRLRMGVRPDQIIDYKALAGDPSDNILGVNGVGAKTAVNLLNEFDSLENIYQKIDQEKLKPGDKSIFHPILKGALLEKLIRDKQQAYDSQKLATIRCDENINFRLEDCLVKNYNKEKAVKILQELDFPSLIKMLPQDKFDSEIQEALF